MLASHTHSANSLRKKGSLSTIISSFYYLTKESSEGSRLDGI